MTLRGYVRVVRERWRIIVAGVLVALLGGLLLFVATPSEYEATTSIYVSSSGTAGGNIDAGYQGSVLAQQRVVSYGQFLTSERLARDVSARLGLGLTPEDLIDKLKVTTAPDSTVLTLTVTDRSPDVAAAIANTASTGFSEMVAFYDKPRDPTQQAIVSAQVVDPALPPTEPVAPVLILYLGAAFLAGAVLGIVAALVRHATDTRVVTPEDLAALTTLPIVGNLPRNDRRRGSTEPAVLGPPPWAPGAEALRGLRTNIERGMGDRRPMVVGVVSAMPAEGRTTLARELASAFLETGNHVCLLEADLRRPALAGVFGLDVRAGLTTVLVGQADRDEAVVEYAGFDVLPAGDAAPNPAELLGSPRMSSILEGLREKYDVIVVDTPPVLLAADTPMLVRACDGLVVVARSGVTKAEELTEAIASLRAASGNVLGVALVGGRVDRVTRRGQESRFGGPKAIEATVSTALVGPRGEKIGLEHNLSARDVSYSHTDSGAKSQELTTDRDRSRAQLKTVTLVETNGRPPAPDLADTPPGGDDNRL